MEKKKEKSSSTNDCLSKKGKFDVSHGHRRNQSQGAIGQGPPAYPPSVHKRNSLGNSETSLPPQHPLNSLRGRKQPDLRARLRAELVGNIESILRPCTETPQANLEEINDKVSWIYDLVETTVVAALKKVKMQQGGNATEYSIEYTEVVPPSLIVAVKDEENAANNSSLPTISPTPSSSTDRPDTADSVKTNASGPHSTSSQCSILSTSGSERIDGIKTEASISASSKYTFRADDDEKTTSTITDNTSLVIHGGAHVIVTEKPVEYEVICNCKHSQILILIQCNELHLVNQSLSTDNDTFTTYNLIKYQKNVQNVNRKDVMGHSTCKLFYCKKDSLLSGLFNPGTKAWKLRLYQLNTKPSWEKNSYFKFSVLEMDLKNSIPVSLGGDEILVASVLNPETRQGSSRIVVYLFPASKVSEKDWKAASCLLPPLHIRATNSKYEIQSCVVISNHIYCSLLLPEVGAYIYKFKLTSLQQHQKEMHDIINIWPDCNWNIEDPNLQNCYLAMFKQDIVIISFRVTNNKSVMEVMRTISPSVFSPTECRHEFSCKMKILAASLVSYDKNPCLIAVMYHDNKANKCYVKQFGTSISSV